MPPSSTQYTLVGFSAELDWKPLRFVEPLPPNRICSACGLVPKRIAFLPCMHVMCESCYEQCAQGDLPACPMDGYEYQDEEVEWREFPSGELLSREVKCWNEQSGCQYVSGVSGISQHFHRECGHHSIRCPKCSATVLRCSMVEHLTSGFCHSEEPLRYQDETQLGYNDDTGLATGNIGALGKQAGEMKKSLLRITGDLSAHSNRLNEMSQAINTMRETQSAHVAEVAERLRENLLQVKGEINLSNESLKQFLVTKIDALNLSGSIKSLQETTKNEVANATSQARDNLSRMTTAIQAVKTSTDDNIQKAIDLVKNVQLDVKLAVAACVFLVPNVKTLQKTAMEKGHAVHDSERVYLRGYHILPGVEFGKKDGSVYLHLTIEVHKGDFDDFVIWPFKQKIRFSIVHPKNGSKECIFQTGANSTQKRYLRPTTSKNAGIVYKGNCFNAQSLIDGGYVEDDQLRIKLELFL
ncbi:uncharacterized protein LOC144104046 isoform X2 [Amblyomma americanum]